MTSTPLEVKQLGMPDHAAAAAAAAAAGANAQRADNDVQKLTESEHGMADAEATAPVGQAGPEQTAESKEGLSVAGRESVPEAEEPTLSQQSPRRATKTARGLLKQFNRKAGASYDAMLARIKNSPDPSAGFQGRVHRAALDAWNIAKEASKAGEGAAELSRLELAAALRAAEPLVLDAFFEALCDELYDVNKILQETDMHDLEEDVDPLKRVTALTKDFYGGLLNLSVKCDGLKAQRETPLEAVALKEVAVACKRVALGNGLPGDGHVVHSMHQGLAAFQHAGRQGCVQVEAMVGTETDWNVAGSK